MPEFQAGKVLSGLNEVAVLAQMIASAARIPTIPALHRNDVEMILGKVQDLADECSTMGLLVSAVAAAELAEWLGKLLGAQVQQDGFIPIPTDIRLNIHSRASEVQNSIRREAKMRKHFIVAAEHQRYYEPQGFPFTPEVDIAFSNIRYDASEAGKCIALERSTAAVFHLVRCLEAGIRAVARCLGIADPTTGYGRNWGQVLKAIKGAMDSRWPNAVDRMSGDGQIFDSLYASLAAIKAPYRDSTMHLEEKYTEEEARYVFEMVKGLMTKIAGRMDENGEPKVP